MTLRVRVGWGLCAALLCGGCELERPKGGFDPDYPDAMLVISGDAAAVDLDGGSTGLFDDDAGEAGILVPPDDPKLAKLVGGYLVRVDNYSSAKSTNPVTLDVSTRVSYFLAAALFERNGSLVWKERVCQETTAMKCNSGCDTDDTTTTVDPNVPRHFLAVDFTERPLQLVEGQAPKLVAARHEPLYLGFDATENASLPTSNTDKRVWDVVTLPGREGVYTTATVRVTALAPLPSTYGHCKVSFVQRLETSWGVPLGSSGGAYVLDGVEKQEVDLHETTSEIIASAAVAGSDLDADECAGKGAKATTTHGPRLISFAQVGLDKIANACPSVAEFEALLPADPP